MLTPNKTGRKTMEANRRAKSGDLRGVFVILAIVVCFCGRTVLGQPWDGNGVEGDPYEIWTAADMQAIGADSGYWDSHFKLMADIDLSAYTGTSFNIIGTSPTKFTGIFDGNGHTISNFTYDSNGTNSIGFFAYVDGPSAEIKNLRLIEPNVDAGNGSYVGSLVGYIKDGTISNCYVEGGSVSGRSNVGGLAYLNRGTITNCHSSCDVSGGACVGGLVGQNRDTIINCYSKDSVSGDESVGGLIGFNNGAVSHCYSLSTVNGDWILGGLAGINGGTISNCYATGDVSASMGYIKMYVGGLVGINGYDHSDGRILNCYSTGSVSGTKNVGGLMGRNGGPYPPWTATVSDSFWDVESSGRSNMCGTEWSRGSGCDDDKGKTTAQMQDPNTYLNAGWDFVGEAINGPNDIWTLCESPSYPRLWWECPPLLEVEVEIMPQTLNVRSKGKWIMCVIRLPEDYNVADIDANSILLEDEVPAERVWLGDEFAVAKFSRRAVQEMLGEVETPAEVELVVSGELSDGTIFEGRDTIRVIDKGGAHSAEVRIKKEKVRKRQAAYRGSEK